ncbi:MAG: MFS transporter [Ignavibacteriaceae bacterium]|nr:MFS transporter [Ignavibacteriaceae bacterium]
MRKGEKRNPWSFIPTQYFAEGIPFVIVNQLSTAMYKSLAISNIFIGFTSFLYLPWSLKLFWGPIVDTYATKRKWTIYMQLLIAVCFLIISFSIRMNSFLFVSLLVFTVIAFLSATQDIATDGFYLNALDKKDQAFFTGIRSTFYRLAMILAGGVLVKLAGDIGSRSGSIVNGWSIAFGIAALLFFILFIYHNIILPYPVTDIAVKTKEKKIPYGLIFKDYFTQKKIGVILAFIILYRFGEGMLLKMAQPFLLDKKEAGGMGFTISDIGIMYGTFGVVALIIGGIIGGWLIKKYGLRKMIWIMALSMNLPNLLFVYMSYAQPHSTWALDLSFIYNIVGTSGSLKYIVNPLVQMCLIIEQFGYGIGFTSFMVYLLYISKGEYKTSHYAISTGLMALGMMIPGFISGIVQQSVGYFWLFSIALLLGIPGMIPIFFLPFDTE